MTKTPAQKALEKYRKSEKYKTRHNEYNKIKQRETRALAAAAKAAGIGTEESK
jgi:hypothetical protein